MQQATNIYVSNPVNPELGTIPSRTIWIFKYKILKLNHPGQELNANKIYRANDLFQNKKKTTAGHFKIINLFPSC